MNWKFKARIQSVVALLPDTLSYPLYYQLQRRFGALRPSRIDPTSRLQVGIELCKRIVDTGRSPTEATFFEIGTGWRLNVPIACWLLGAARTVTVDLNRYLKMELLHQDLAYFQKHADRLSAMFARQLPQYFDRQRFEKLLTLRPADAADFCQAIRVQYLAPIDASSTSLPDASIDYHVSCNVLEHIPTDVLRGILIEANRIVRPDGLLVHRVDHSDHFSHSDPSISPINFLRFADSTWGRWADNRYAYVNRLREDDYLHLFAAQGQSLEVVDSQPDPEVLAALNGGVSLAGRFENKPHETLARLHSIFVARPARPAVARVA